MANIFSDVFGSTPSAAPYVPTELGPEQLKAIMENISAFPEIQQLGGLYENYMLDQFNQAGFPLQGILQGGNQMVQSMEQVGQQMLQGQVPQDVQDQIRRQDALTSMLSGGPGGASALTARDLGLTSLNLIGQGAQLAGQAGNAAQQWAGLASGLMMSPSGMMVTPQQQAQMTMQNNLYQQATQQLRNNLGAAPNPIAAGVSGTIMNLLGAYLGGGRGGMGGSAGGSQAGGGITPSYSSILGSSQGSGNWMGNAAQGGAYQPPAASSGFNFGGIPTAAQTGFQSAPASSPVNFGGGYSGSLPANWQTNPFDTSSTGGLDLSSMMAYQSNFGGF